MAHRPALLPYALPVGAALLGAGAAVALLRTTRRRLSTVPSGTHTYRLDAAPFPSQPGPGALVHVPPGFDRGRPLDVVVYFRGWSSCVSAVAGEERAACRPGGPTHRASLLAQQFDRANVNALLVLPELRVEQATGDPGRLGRANGLREFLDELLGDKMAPLLGGGRSAGSVRRLILAAHSGGYWATASCLARGGVPASQVWLYDALYGELDEFAAFGRQCLSGATPGMRLLSVYATGSPRDNSLDLARRLRRGAFGANVVLRDELDAPTAPDLAGAAVFARARMSHDEVPRHLLLPSLASAGLERAS
jgi:hypothetical protein